MDVGIRDWGCGVSKGAEEGHAGMEAVVGEERGEEGSRVLGIIIAELGQGKEAGPIGLLVVAVDSQGLRSSV